MERRYQYVRRRNDDWAKVIVDFRPDGTCEFSEQEAYEVIWRPFCPGRQERLFVDRMVREKCKDSKAIVLE